MKAWLNRALALLHASLEPPRHELNELDWKAGVSPDKRRLAEHLSAFANYPSGGFLVYGVAQDGTHAGLDAAAIEVAIGQLANLGRDAVEPPIALDHAVARLDGVPLLVVHVPESSVKPVHIRGKALDEAFIRSGGTTRRASRQEIGALMLHSRTPSWEELRASVHVADAELLRRFDVAPIHAMLDRPVPRSETEQIEWLAAEGFVSRDPAGGGYVTNLGAVAAARRLLDYPGLDRKVVRVVVYDGVHKGRTRHERDGTRGYAVAFEGLLGYVNEQLPAHEVTTGGLRTVRRTYPEDALREIIANALIHQDFSVTGSGPMIELFDDRVEVSNPGGLLPSKRLDRLIGTRPESRNERLARAFRRYRICEERGSGLIKAGLAMETAGLPPLRFEAGPGYFKATLPGPRTYAQMTPRERLDACYQHAVLRHLSSATLTNTSLRERLRMPERQRSMVSVLIQTALDERLIKPADPENRSRKHAEYIPAWVGQP